MSGNLECINPALIFNTGGKLEVSTLQEGPLERAAKNNTKKTRGPPKVSVNNNIKKVRRGGVDLERREKRRIKLLGERARRANFSITLEKIRAFLVDNVLCDKRLSGILGKYEFNRISKGNLLKATYEILSELLLDNQKLHKILTAVGYCLNEYNDF